MSFVRREQIFIILLSISLNFGVFANVCIKDSITKITTAVPSSKLVNYGGDSALEIYKRDDAIKIFSDSIEKRSSNVKLGSMPFMKIHPEKNATRQTVVLLHGLSDSPGSMKVLADKYYKKGYDVIAPLYRDHGLQDKKLRKKATRKVKLRDWRADVDEALSVAKSINPNQKVSVVGYSMGGGLALDAAKRFPDLVDDLVFIAPLFQMKNILRPKLARVVGLFKKFVSKDIAEGGHFYDGFALNQIVEAGKLTSSLKKELKNPTLKQRMLFFLTDQESAVSNKAVKEYAEKNGNKEFVYIFDNDTMKKEGAPVIHRDLPMATIQSSGERNPAIEPGRRILDEFLDNK